MRFKKRYLKYSIEFAEKLDESQARLLVDEALMQLLGSKGIAEAKVEFKKFDEGKQLFWVKCSAAGVDEVMAGLALKRFFKGGNVVLCLAEVTGSLKE